MGRKSKLIRNYDSEGNLVSKECCKCHEIKEVSEFSKDKSKKDGIRTTCKECDNKRHSEEYYKQNVNKERIQQRGIIRNYDDNGNLISKECSKCHEIKEVSEFNKDKSKKDGVATACKECKKEQISEYYKQNPNKLKERQAKYYKQNADKVKENQAKYYKQNKDKRKEYMAKYRKQNDDKERERQAKYRKQNPNKVREYDAKQYNSRVKQALAEIKAYVEKDSERFNYDSSKEIYGIVYLVYNTCSQRYYVGQTTVGFDNRYKNSWLNEHSYKDTVKEDLQKYGEDSFEYTKIFKVAHNQEELDKLEAYYIEYFDSYKNGYNENRGNIFTERGKN